MTFDKIDLVRGHGDGLIVAKFALELSSIGFGFDAIAVTLPALILAFISSIGLTMLKPLKRAMALR